MGFLSSMLPMVAGAALASTGIGAPAAAAMLGGLQYARTGSLQKGLMAGLGAYGGAGIGSNLAAMGQNAAADAAVANVPQTNLTGIDALDMQTGALPDYNTNLQAAREAAIKGAQATPFETMGKGISTAFQNPSQFANTMTRPDMMKYGLAAAAPALMTTTQQPQLPAGDSTMPQRLRYDQGTATPFPQPDVPGYGNLGQDFGRQQSYFPNAGYRQITPEEAKSIRGYAAGGYMGGGPVEAMSNANAVGENTGYPQADITGHAYATPWQTPVSQNVVAGTADTGVNRMTGQMLAEGGAVDPTPDFEQPYTAMARGGLSDLGSYSDGGRLLRGPGDGVSDSIPAVIGKKKPARLADGEFVVPARIVSELGNGSTEAGARKLYAMLDRVQSARKKSIGKGKVAHNSRADKYLPA
jgi:hypothetical protein